VVRKSKSEPLPPPPHDQRMVPLLKLVEHRAQQQDCTECAADDIAEQMRYKKKGGQPRLQSARRLKRAPWGAEPTKLEPLDIYFWRSHGVRQVGGGLLVAPLGQEPELDRKADDYVYYAFLPEYEKIFGPVDANHSTAVPTQQEVPETRGRKPVHNWPEICFEFAQRLVKLGPSAGNKSVSTLAGGLEQWCINRYGKAPAFSELRDFISELFKVLRIPRK
jgi:hypothetical protein